MIFQLIIFPVIIALVGFFARRPFLNFPLDDDFAIYTYRVRFAARGMQWKKDLQIIGIPVWKMMLLEKVYGKPEGGIQRLRLLQTGFHVAGSLVIFSCLIVFTGNPWAALAGGLLHAFYGSPPDLTAGSFNHEQFYIPWIFLGLVLAVSGPGTVFLAGLCFGLATIPKLTSGLYPAVLMWVIGARYGWGSMALFTTAAALPLLISNLVDYKLGFWDEESRTQNQTRLATSLRLSRTKKMYFSFVREIKELAMKTLPVWAAGVPGLVIMFFGPHGIWIAAFTLVTLAMIFFQRGFSRYHYLPWLSLLALASGRAIDGVLQLGGAAAFVLLSLFSGIVVWNLINNLFFYVRPAHPSTLARHEKFDQYLYLPYVGKLLKRLIRMRGEKENRIFVWGTFSQLYHLTDMPASDNFLHYSIGPWDTPALEGFFDAVIGGLLRHKPVYLIRAFPDLNMEVLEQVTGLQYRLVKVILARYPLYRLTAFTSVPQNPLALPWREKMRMMEALTDSDWHAPAVDRSDADAGRITTALKECRKLTRMNPRDWRGLIFLGELYDQVGRHEKSAAAFTESLRIEQEHGHIRVLLAKQKIKLGHTVEAASLMAEETRLFGKNAEIPYLRGMIQQQLDKHREAVENFERFRRDFPDRHDCWESLIESLTILQDREHLHSVYLEAGELSNTKDREWLQTRVATAMAKMDAEDLPEYVTLEHYLKRDPKNLMLVYAKASALEPADHIEDAYALFEQIAFADTYKHLRARALFRLARLSAVEEREELLMECLRLEPTHGAARKMLREPRGYPAPKTTPARQVA